MSDFRLDASYGSIHVTLYENISRVIQVGSNTVLEYSCELVEVYGAGTYDASSYIYEGVSASGPYSELIESTFSTCNRGRFRSMYATRDDSAGNHLESSIKVTGAIVDLKQSLIRGDASALITNVDIQCYSIADSFDFYGALAGLNSANDYYIIGDAKCEINIQCHYIGNAAIEAAHIYKCTIDADSFGYGIFQGSWVTIVDMRNDIPIPALMFNGCGNLIRFNTKKICNRTYYNYVKGIERNYQGYANFYHCNSLDTFVIEDGVVLTSSDDAFTVSSGLVKPTTIYTNDQNIRNINWLQRYRRDVTFAYKPTICGKVLNIVHEGSVLNFDPMPEYTPPIYDPDVIYMMHEGAIVRFKLVLPSDPLASDVYIKHNGVLMCLANN